ncbi:hypothetical protein D3C77_674560 [compost metagenome]
MLIRLRTGLASPGAELADAGAQRRAAVPPPNQIGLLFGSAFIDPLEPVVDRHDRSVRPDSPEERAMGHFLHPGVDWGGAIFGPMRPPSPAHQVYMKQSIFQA